MTESGASAAPRTRDWASVRDSRIVGVLKTAFAATAIVAIAFAIYRSWDLLESLWPSLRGWNLLGAVLVWTLMHFISPFLPMLVLSEERPLPYREALRIHASRLPARYLPGGVWHTVGRVLDFKGLGYSSGALAKFVLFENLTAPAFTLAVGGALLFWSGDSEWARWAGAVSAACALGYCAIPWMVNVVTRSSTRPPVATYVRISATLAIFWSLAATAFLLFVSGFAASVFTAPKLEIVGAYLVSWGVGFVAIFAPQGVGVFEYVAGVLLGQGASVLGAASIMALFRVIVLCADVFAWAAVSVALRRA